MTFVGDEVGEYAHLFFSPHPYSQTFLNPQYEASLLPIYAVTVSMGLWAFITAGGSLRSIQRSLSCKD